MDEVFYTVMKINGDYAIMLSDEGVENVVAMAFLPIAVYEKSRLHYKDFRYTILD